MTALGMPRPRRALTAAVLALLTGATGFAATATAGAPSAAAATTPPRPAPTPTGSATGCAAGLTAVRLTTGPAPARQTAGNRPVVTPMPGGGSQRIPCLAPAPTPMPAPAVAPEHVVGGPLLAGTGVVSDVPPGVPAPPDLAAVSYVLADADTGQILAAKHPHAWLLPASTLKTLTALVVMPALPLSTVVVGTEEDVRADGTRVGITVDGRYTVDDLLNALVMASANDAAYALARSYGGRDRLLADMNAAAAHLGAFDTLAADPAGLDAPGQRSSAYDLALLGAAVMKLPDYRRRVGQRSVLFPGGVLLPSTGPTRAPVPGPPYQIQESNQLVPIYPGVIGVKNGFTQAARNTYIGMVRDPAGASGGRTLLVTVMGSPEPLTLGLPALLDWGFAYAGRVRPVGRLVAPGEARRPPELGGATPATGAGTPETEDPTVVVTPLEETAVATPGAPARGAGWWTDLPDLARWALLGLVGLLAGGGALVARAIRRRPRGAYER